MKFIDLNDDKPYTLPDLHNDWVQFREEDPENHAPDFKTELFEILMAAVNGRNDLEIVGLTAHEISDYIISLRSKVMNERMV